MSKTILITGAGTGLGHGTALGLAKNGYTVIATVENWPQVTQLRADVEEAGLSDKVTVEKMDYLNFDDIDSVVNKYADKVDIFEVNVFQTLELIQRFVKVFVARGYGKIIPISSIAGFFTFDYLAPYCASKHALEAVLQTMYQELKGTGVQVATINPGPFRTGFNDRMYDTLDQWYDPKQNFTPEQAIRDVQQLFAGDDLQLDPQSMIDFMIETIPADDHAFRNVHPEGAIEDTNKYQKSIYEWQSSPQQAKTKKAA